MERSQQRAAFTQDVPLDEEAWLLGQPPLRHYLDFMKDVVAEGDRLTPSAAAAVWREANDYYHELEEQEAGIADEVECRELDRSLAPLVEEVKAQPSYRRSFDQLPATFAMVELDKLVVFQKSITDTFVKALTRRLGPSPSPADVFRFAIPIGGAPAPVEVRRYGSKRYVFESESTDFRYHEARLLSPEALVDRDAYGGAAGVVGIFVGFGTNFLSAVKSDDRLILHNGHHRACALRELGYTHAPCLIQTVTRQDELELVAKDTVAEDPDFYLRAARPPLLKDYFDPRIRRTYRTKKQVRAIEVTFEVREIFTDARASV